MKYYTDTIDNRDTEFTIDQYWIFNLDSEYSSEIDYLTSCDSDELRESLGLPEFDDVEFFIDDYLEFEFDKNGDYHEALALGSIEIIRELDREEGVSLFGSIELTGTDSPRYYNYTTDSYTMAIRYDRDRLAGWINDHPDKFQKYLDDTPNLNFHDSWRYDPLDRWGNSWIDALYSVWLLCYIDFLYEAKANMGDYIADMFDRTSEAAYNAIHWEINPNKKPECADRLAKTLDQKEFLRTQTALELGGA